MSLNTLVWDFFHVPGNQILVAFAHGLVFFLMGFAVLLQSRHRRHTSDVTLTRSLTFLGMFGIVQAFAVWGSTFVPIQQTYLPPAAIEVLYSVQTFLVAAASALLLHFGSRLWADTVGHTSRLRKVAHWLAPVCFGTWTAFYLVYWLRIPPDATADLVGAGQVLARYGMAIPGAVITCIALILQARELHLLRMEHLVTYLKWLTFSFGLYGVTSTVLIPATSFGFAALVNRDAFLRVTGLPVDVLAGTAGLLMAIFAVRILEIFDIELGRRLSAARRMKVLLDERDRIARELHDGTIQSLYAIGLSLEAATLSLDPDSKAYEILKSVMERLDETIQDMRGYIMDLKGYADHADLGELLRALVDQLSEEYNVEIHLDYRPLESGDLPSEFRNHLLQIVREAVSNAARHGKADRVRITLTNHSGLRMEIVDNGIGFDAEKVWREYAEDTEQRVHHGLRNMRQRAELLGGYLNVKSERGKGTKVIVTLPEEVRKHE